MKYSASLMLLCIVFFPVLSQVKTDNKQMFLGGYGKEIEGNSIIYNSGLDNVNEALITRADNGKQRIIWESVPAIFDKNKEKVTFLYYIGYDLRTPGTKFHFSINGAQQGSIAIPKRSEKTWELTLENGDKLAFDWKYTDANNDYYGFLYHTTNVKNLTKGQPLQLTLVGDNAKEQTWFMVFKKNLSESIKVTPLPSIVKVNNESHQSILVEVNYLKPSSHTKIFINNELAKEFTLKAGIQNISLSYPSVTKETNMDIRLENEYVTMNSSTTLKPIKKWEVSFIQHSHTDIGYTRSQMEILAEHLRYIDYALDYCDATDDYPEDSKFRWTCEASWAVDEYLTNRSPQQIERLKQRIKEGRIEVTGMYFNFNELPDEQTLAASLAPIKSITEKGIPVTSAMQNDVNGIGWCMNDYFNTIDIKYLNMGTHGHKALISFDTPLAFWWISPSGKRMLAFRAEHYMIGNTAFGIHLEEFENFEVKMLNYLTKLEERNYPYDKIAIQHSGFLIDNSPPSIMSSKMIKKWNEKYEWPKIKTSIVNDFFEDIEKQYGDDLQEIKAHWPDWWTDGFASGAREVAASRTAHVDLIAAQGGLSMAKMLGSQMPKGLNDRITEANKALLFYGEHTFGASESVSDPYGQASMEQRKIKESYAWEAARRSKMITEEALGLLNDYAGRSETPSMAVYNTLNWERSGLVTTFIDHQQIGTNQSMRLVDEEGNTYPAQVVEHRHGGSYWSAWVEGIPAFGFKKFNIEVFEDEHTHSHEGETEAHSHNENFNYSEKGSMVQLDNPWYSITLNKDKGTIQQIYDKDLRQTLVDEEAEYQTGEFILEQLGTREQLQSTILDNGSRYGHLVDYTRQPLDTVWLSEIKEGDIWNTIKFRGKTKTALDDQDAFSLEVRVFNTTKRIDFVYQLKKKPITDPESFYIAFPFQLPEGKIYAEIAGGTMEAGVDQIPGSANDWNTVQNFTQVKSPTQQIVLVSPEAPIMQFGNINTGRFKYAAKPETTHLFSWPMNNYWVTNFSADQRGMYTWSYKLTSFNNGDNKDAVKFSWGSRVPFLARVVPAGVKKESPVNGKSVLSELPENVLLINATPVANENAIVFHFREVAGQHTSFKPESSFIEKGKWSEINVIGTDPKPVKTLEILPLESKFFKLTW